MFARRLAIGVRSSWPASATSWRWASTERSSASSVRLKLSASRPSSSLPLTSSRPDRSSSLLPGALSAVCRSVLAVNRLIGASAILATAAPNAAASAIPAAPTIARISTSSLSSLSTSVSGRATITAPRGPIP